MDSVRKYLAAVFAPFALAAAQADPAKAARIEDNKQVVLDFWRVVIEARDLDQVERFLAPDLIQHNPRMTGGIEGFRELAKVYWKGESKRPVEPVLREPPELVLANDDLVLLMFRRPTPEPSDPAKTYDRFSFDLYRVAGGKIVEHWDEIRK